MVVGLPLGAAPSVTDVDRLDRLHVDRAGEVDAVRFDELCSPDAGGEHVWLEVAAPSRRLGRATDDGFAAGFDATIDFDGSKGRLSDDGHRVRAHVPAIT